MIGLFLDIAIKVVIVFCCYKVVRPRDGWKQVTEVTRTARQHLDKWAYNHKEDWPIYQDGGTPKAFY